MHFAEVPHHQRERHSLPPLQTLFRGDVIRSVESILPRDRRALKSLPEHIRERLQYPAKIVVA